MKAVWLSLWIMCIGLVAGAATLAFSAWIAPFFGGAAASSPLSAIFPAGTVSGVVLAIFVKILRSNPPEA